MSKDDFEEVTVRLREAKEGEMSDTSFLERIVNCGAGLTNFLSQEPSGILNEFEEQCLFGWIIEIKGSDPDVGSKRDVGDLRVVVPFVGQDSFGRG
jgi:hypothetical protein